MHLSEELGEAMTELGRMEIICRARGEFDLAGELGKAFKITRGKLDDETKKIVNPGNRKQREAQLNSELEALEANLRGGDASLLLTKLIGERFKEEIADILSWLSAIIVKLEKHGDLAGLPGKFTKVIAGGLRVLQCPWCHEEACSDGCLVLHGVSGEIRETVSKF
jgi:NTP pyrophosphatase (non-canonical NTP hydrolase)